MTNIMKRVIRKVVNIFGFDIIRTEKINYGIYKNYPQDSLSDGRFYNIGAGNFYHPYWTNIDYAFQHYKEAQTRPFLNYNLMEMKPLPIENNVAELIYSSHTIEHITDEAVRNILTESYRILKPGGAIRLTTPNAWLEYQAYKKNDTKFWYWVDSYSRTGSWEKLYKIPLSKASIHQLFLHHFASQLCEIDIDDSPTKKYTDAEISEIFTNYPPVQTLDYFTKQCKFNPDHPGNHVNWWTHEKLISFLKDAGFTDPYISGWGQSVFPPLRDINCFDKTHPKISLYVEAIK